MSNPEQGFVEKMRQAMKDLQECKTIIARSEESQLQHWKMLAGSHYEEMIRSPEAAQRFLSDEDKKLRLAALAILVFHWAAAPIIARIIEKMAFDDSDEEVRLAALLSLGNAYAGTSNQRLLRVFSKMVRDDNLASEYRRTAYRNLFRVKGISIDQWPPPNFRFPEQVDWAFVASANANEPSQ